MLFYLPLLLYLCNIACHLTAAEQAQSPHKELSISVVIPCVPKHFQYLHQLLVHYARQTVTPQEIIIALSEAHLANESEIHKLTQHAWPFSVHFMNTQVKMLAGANRNRGASYAQGDIIMFQDADDIPHPQMVEIVKYFFETYDIVHLLYRFIPQKGWHHPDQTGPKEFVRYAPTQIQFTTYHHEGEYYGTHLRISNGTPCVLRSALDELQFLTDTNHEEDVTFNKQAITRFPGKSILVHAYLSHYRKLLSAAYA